MDKTRQYILDEIRRTASANGGTPLGIKQFEQETSIRRHEWGCYWPRFGDAQREAGFEANTRNLAIPDEVILRRLAELTREIGRRPTSGDLRVARKADPSFPSVEAILRLAGTFEGVTRLLVAFCEANADHKDIEGFLGTPQVDDSAHAALSRASRHVRIEGYVYLLKYGRHYKIGRTNSTGRRERELAIQMPEKPHLVHSIKTDDPEGIEHYWHRRFADRRLNGEWFDLTADDVSAFRWRKFM